MVSKKGPILGGRKVTFCCYLLHFRKVGPLKKVSILEPFWEPLGHMGSNILSKGGPRGARRASKRVPKFGVAFETQNGSKTGGVKMHFWGPGELWSLPEPASG